MKHRRYDSQLACNRGVSSAAMENMRRDRHQSAWMWSQQPQALKMCHGIFGSTDQAKSKAHLSHSQWCFDGSAACGCVCRDPSLLCTRADSESCQEGVQDKVQARSMRAVMRPTPLRSSPMTVVLFFRSSDSCAAPRGPTRSPATEQEGKATAGNEWDGSGSGWCREHTRRGESVVTGECHCVCETS